MKGTNNSVELIEDYVQSPGILILKAFCAKHLSRKNSVHLLSYETSKDDLHFPSDVQIHECFQDPLGWISDNQCIPSLLTDIECNIGSQNDDVVLVIDSLAHLAQNSVSLVRDINKIVNNLGPVKVKQIIALVHEDSIHGERESALKSLNCVFRTHIDLLSESSAAIIHKKSSGKILSQVNSFFWNKDLNELECKQIEDSFEYKPPASSEEPRSTFNLNLNDDEKLAREQLVLPYLNKSGEVGVQSGGGGGGVIYIEPEDYDEEDPDDDLDI